MEKKKVSFKELLGIKDSEKSVDVVSSFPKDTFYHDQTTDSGLSLHPPRAPIIGEKSVGFGQRDASEKNNGSGLTERVVGTDSKPIIDFSYLTSNSSFQRAIMEFIKKFVPGFENVEARGSKEVMVKSFDCNAQNYLKIIKDIKSGEFKLVKVGTYSNEELGVDEK